MKNTHQLLLILCITLGVTFSSVAQHTISGTITDAETSEVLPGVNIIVKDSPTIGTSTDAEGKFSLTIPSLEETLLFSYVGYLTREVTVEGQETLDVQLTIDTQILEDLVVIGYGEEQESDVTGVISSVNAEEFNKGTNVSPDQLIAGKVAGVSITNNSGEPGGQNTIRIRGGTSINASNDPLFVIDGVPIDNSANSSRNPLNFLNPEDIKSFTVLKDASATAIYGTRASNGVIVITTKEGTRDSSPQLSYSGWTSIANSAGETNVLNADQFRSAVQEFAPSRVDLLGNANTNWQDQVLRAAIGQSHSVNISGGTENATYRASLGYLDQQGILETSTTDRLNVGFNYNQSLFDDQLNIDANIKGARTKDQFAPGGTVGNAVRFAPTQPVLDPGNEFGGFWEWDQDLGTKNPVAEYNLIQNFGDTFRSVGNISFDYSLPVIQNLNAEVNLGYDVTTGDNQFFAPSNLRSQYSTNGQISNSSYEKVNTLLDAYLRYNVDLGQINSSLRLLGGYSYQQFDERFPSFRGEDLSSNLLGLGSTAPAQETFTSLFAVENRLISAFGRLNYNYDDRYLLTATIRRDGSSRFGPSNRWGTFPSGALAWRISEESFFDSMPSFISDLKLRVGAGITGNQQIGNFQYLNTYTFSDGQARYQFGDEFVTTLRPSGVDPTLKWEETKSYNVGFDYGLLNGRFNGSVEYYYKKTEDLLFTVAVPAGSNLTNRILTNIGSLQNRGLEFTIDGTVINKNDFFWNTGFNFAINDNEVLKLTNFNAPGFQGFQTGGISGGVGNQIQILQVGESVNAFYVFKQRFDDDGSPLNDGVDHNGDGEINLADMYEDINGDGTVNAEDRRPFGKPAPDATLGFTSQMNYQNFDFSFTLRGAIGNEVYNNIASSLGNFSRVNEIVPNNLHESVLENEFTEAQLFSDIYVEDGSYLRMDNITLGYTFNNLFNTLKGLRLYATGQNLFVITGYSGLEPEVQQGIDNNLYPRARTYIFGVNLDF